MSPVALVANQAERGHAPKATRRGEIYRDFFAALTAFIIWLRSSAGIFARPLPLWAALERVLGEKSEST